MTLEHLFAPLRIGPLELPCRVGQLVAQTATPVQAIQRHADRECRIARDNEAAVGGDSQERVGGLFVTEPVPALDALSGVA